MTAAGIPAGNRKHKMQMMILTRHMAGSPLNSIHHFPDKWFSEITVLSYQIIRGWSMDGNLTGIVFYSAGDVLRFKCPSLAGRAGKGRPALKLRTEVHDRPPRNDPRSPDQVPPRRSIFIRAGLRSGIDDKGVGIDIIILVILLNIIYMIRPDIDVVSVRNRRDAA